MEAEAFLAAMRDFKLADGRDRVVRHGHGPERTIQTGIGPVEVSSVKIRDRGAAIDGERIRFSSAILPKWARRTKFGVILSTAVVATMTDPKAFRTGREFAAWIGLVPRQNSTGGKERLGSISKQGDRYLRRLLVLGAISIVGTARTRPDKYPWVTELLGRRPAKVVAVALANKMARTAWAVLAKGETYRAPARSSSAAIVAAA